ncbi:hypothetical protein L208DRAFT_1237982 [Tricholoma matsutake]|nr:hypothetical protein L208DRAFT_1237982 [Tricholoma matsutake 945]
MEHPSGGFDWSTSHNSPFELSKLVLINFPRSHCDTVPADLSISRLNLNSSTTTQTVNTIQTYKYFRVIFDSKLCWTAHQAKVVASATWWLLQVACLSKVSGSMPPSWVQQLYNTVAVPAFIYAADIWYTGIHIPPSRKKRVGSVAVTNKLIPIQ